jgi:phosphoglycerate dehydrogenase-like enzyme
VGSPGIFVTDRLPIQARQVLASYEVLEREASDEKLAACEVLMTWPSRAKGDLLKKMKRVRMVQSLAAGVDGIEFSSLGPGVRVYSNAGAYASSVAEHAWGLLLGVAKGIHRRKERVVPRRLRGGSLLVIGCGAIGSEVARLSRSLGMSTIGVSRSFRSPEFFDERYPPDELGRVLGRADAVVVALPLTSRTRGILDHDALMKAKDSVLVVNVGRGETVDEAGLVAWLGERPESRYATDVFWKRAGREDFSTRAWELPNFAGTLHISGVPQGETLLGPMLQAAENVKMFLETGDARNRVDVSEYG